MKLTEDLQHMLISMERYDIDYMRAYPEDTRFILDLFHRVYKQLDTKVLWILIQDIERAKEYVEHMREFIETGKINVDYAAWEKFGSELKDEMRKRGYIIAGTGWANMTCIGNMDREGEKKKLSDVTISQFEFDKIMIYAYEYAVCRQSYMSNWTSDYIREQADNLGGYFKAYFVEKFNVDRVPENCPDLIAMWQKTLEIIKETQSKN